MQAPVTENISNIYKEKYFSPLIFPSLFRWSQCKYSNVISRILQINLINIHHQLSSFQTISSQAISQLCQTNHAVQIQVWRQFKHHQEDSDQDSDCCQQQQARSGVLQDSITFIQDHSAKHLQCCCQTKHSWSHSE